MNTLGTVIGIITIVLMIVGFMPFVGALNWFNIPIAIIGLVISVIGNSKGGKVMCLLAIIVGAFRLFMGGGIL